MNRILLSVLIVATAALAQAQSSPVQIVPMSTVSPQSVQRERLVEQSGNWAIIRNGSINQFPLNLYLVDLPRGGQSTSQNLISQFGKIWGYVDQQFAVVEVFSEGHRDALAQRMHLLSPLCGGVRALYPEVLPGFRQPTAQWLPQGRFGFNRMKFDTDSLIKKVELNRIQQDIRTMEAFKTRFHSHPEGKLAAEKIARMYSSLTPKERTDVKINLFNHSRTPQKSVIVRIEGATHPEEVIVLGSHLDSINPSTGSEFAPGADDNASGTATNMEVFRVLMETGIRPGRTIEIHAYAAEEVGLVGSAEVARTYRKNNARVIAMIQHDMTAYSARPTSVLTLLSSDTDPQLTQNLKSLAERYLKAQVQIKSLSWGTSDHRSWSSQGYPAAFPFEDPDMMNHSIHSSNDVYSVLNNFDQAAQFSRLALAYVAEFGGI